MTAPFWDHEAGFEGPDFSDNPWDVLFLDKQKVPGISDVRCRGIERIDEPKRTGGDGGPIILRGRELCHVEMTVKLWTPSQWIIWQILEAQIWRLPGKPARHDAKAPKTATVPVFLQRPTATSSGVPLLLQDPDLVPAVDSKGVPTAVQRVPVPTEAERIQLNGAIEIAHPALRKGVTHVIIKQIDSPIDAPERGAKLIRLQAIQFMKDFKTNVTKKAQGPRLAAEITAASGERPKNAPPPKPSETDGVPALLRAPAAGGS
jgi:hypothetical protein